MKRNENRIVKRSGLFILLLIIGCMLVCCTPDFEVLAQEGYGLEEDAVSPGEIYVNEPAQSVKMRNTLVGDTQKTVYNPGGADLTDVLGVERANVLSWLGQHVNDDYYLGTPYVPNDWRSPNGDPSFNGTPGMNCTGFVWHVLRQAGANENTPGLKGWVSLIVNNRMEYVTYTGSNWNDVAASVATDGICEPGDVIWTWDMTKGELKNGLSYHISPKHHVSFFIGTYFDGMKEPGNPYWQEGEVFDRIWHSADDNASGTSGIGNMATWMVPKEWTGPYAVTVLKMKDRKGSVELQKTSALPTLTENNSCYSLEGAEYGIYKGDTQIATMTTDKNGYAKAENLPVGTYQIKELSPPEGYALNKQSYEAEIRFGETTQVEVQDMPQSGPAEIVVSKTDAETGLSDPQGTASLENAEFTVKYYAVHAESDPGIQGIEPVRTWVFRTDQTGTVKLDETYKVSGDDLYQNTAGNCVFPLGTVTIQETKAPAGYLLNQEMFVRQITSDGMTEEVHTYQSPIVLETPQKGMIELQKKDGETGNNISQGSGTLQGAVYDIFAKEAYQAGDHMESPSYCGTLTTDEKGIARSAELSFGTYYVKERQASTGYLVDPDLYEVVISADKPDGRLFIKKVSVKEQIIRGNVEIIKVKENQDEDEETLEGLEGIEFTFRSDTTGKIVKKIITDKNGYATTAEKDNPRGGLVYDTYTVTETKHPEGVKPIEPFQVTIREEGVSLKGIYKENKLIVSPVSVVKVDQSTGKHIPIADTEFRLLDENKKPVTMTTYYPDKIVHETFKTDENGQFTFPAKLKAGSYYLEEIKAPKGYLKGEILQFEVTEGSVWEQPLVIRYADENAMGQIWITKQSADRKEKLNGAVFEIRAAEDIITPDGTVRMKKGTLAETLTIENGEAVSELLYLGKYEVRETKQPDGFVLDDESRIIELIYKDQETGIVIGELEVVNKPTEITVIKIDAESEKPLAGVRFRVWNKDMEAEPDPEMGVAQEFVTDGDGQFTIQRLMPGTYCFQETETLPGYVLNEDIHEVAIEKDGRINGKEAGQLIVENEPVEPEEPEQPPKKPEEPPKEPEKPKQEEPKEPEKTVVKTGDEFPGVYFIAVGLSGIVLGFILWKAQKRKFRKRR